MSLEGQEKAVRAYCNQHDIQLLELFTDAGESAKTADRPSLKAALEYVARNKNELDYFIIYKIDRLSRNTLDFAQIASQLARSGVQLISTQENFTDSSVGKLQANVLSAFAQYDNDVRGERTQQGMIQRLEQGAWPHLAPLGYKNFKDDMSRPTLILGPQSAEITQLLRQYAYQDMTLKELYDYSLQLGIESRRGYPISKQALRNMLSNPIYAGKILQRDKSLIKGLHKALITDEEFLIIQDKLAGRNRQYVTAPVDDWPLRGGFVRCATCHSSLTSSTPKGRAGKRYNVYSCPSCRKADVGHSVSVPRSVLHDKFVELMDEIAPTEEFARQFKNRIATRWEQESKVAERERGRVQHEIVKLRERQRNALNLFVEKQITLEEKEILMGQIDDEIRGCQEELDSLVVDSLEKEAVVDFALSVIKNSSKLWRASNVETKRAIQSAVFPEGVEYHFVSGFRTPKMGSQYLLKKKIAPGDANNSNVVAATGIEPVTLGL